MRQPLGGGTGHVFAVDGRGEVDRDEVTGLHGPVHAGQRAEPGAQRLEFGIDLVVGDLDRFDRHAQRVQVRNLQLGADVDLGEELQLLSVFLVGHLDVGPADRLHVGLGEGLAVAAGHGVLDDLVEQGLAAKARLEQPGRRLAGPEARQPNLLGQLLVGPLEIGLEFGNGTSTLMRTRVGLNCVTVLFTACSSVCRVCVRRCAGRSGRGDRI